MEMDIIEEAELLWKIRKRRERELFGPLPPARLDDVDRRIQAIREGKRRAEEYGGLEVFSRRFQFSEITEIERLWENSSSSRGNEIDYDSFSMFSFSVFSENLPGHIHDIIAREINVAVQFLRDEKTAEDGQAQAEDQKIIAELFDLLTNGLQEGTRDAQCRIALLTLLNPCSYKGISLQSELQPDACYLDEEAVDEVLSKWDLKRKHAQAAEIKRLLAIVQGMYPNVTFNDKPVADFISANPTP